MQQLLEVEAGDSIGLTAGIHSLVRLQEAPVPASRDEP